MVTILEYARFIFRNCLFAATGARCTMAGEYIISSSGIMVISKDIWNMLID